MSNGLGASNRLGALLEQVLSEQAEMGAVELFSDRHDAGLIGEAGWYRDLLPASPPGPGQQYGFDVDLDSCTGCKACVTACHRRNGLDEGESWRSAGRLEARGPQVVTTACHHCVEPACLVGCPVNAYEKDPVTGIVVHLDDQCIGCGYCLMTCPYEVPRFNDRLGIVRKCDMCRGRLEAGEAPACVEACPNGAIRISVVDLGAQREAAAGGRFLIGAPAPSATVPSTTYRSRRQLSGAAVGAPGAVGPPRPGRIEPALVATLVLSQLSVGMALAGAIAGSSDDHIAGLALMAVLLGAGAAIAGVTHLGRPRYAWRAVLGWRHSWLSREVLAIGAFVGLAGAWAGASLAGSGLGGPGGPGLAAAVAALGWAAAAAGLGVISCSVMVYAVTGRKWWRASLGAVRFACTASVGALAGLALVVALAGTGAGAALAGTGAGAALAGTGAGAALAGTGAGAALAGTGAGAALALALVVLTAGVLVGEHLWRARLRRSCLSAEMAGSAALLCRRGLRSLRNWRCGCSLAGALVLGDVLALAGPGAGRVLAPAGFALVLAGELVGRSLMFVAVAPTRMPGGRQ